MKSHRSTQQAGEKLTPLPAAAGDIITQKHSMDLLASPSERIPRQDSSLIDSSATAEPQDLLFQI